MNQRAFVGAAASLILLSVIFAGCSDDTASSPAERTDAGADSGPAEPGPEPDGGSTHPGTTTDSGAAPRANRAPEIRTALEPLAEAGCSWMFKCCSDSEISYRFGTTSDAKDCTARILDSVMRQGYVSVATSDSARQVLQAFDRLAYSAHPSRIRIDAAALDACVKQISGEACNAATAKDHCVPKPPPAPSEDACSAEKILLGAQKAGEPCQSLECEQGLSCQYVDNEGVCVPQAKEGDSCFGDFACGDLVCDLRTGKCVAGHDAGEKCSYADPANPVSGTEAERCRPGLFCDTVTLKCGDPSCAGGASCNEDSGCPKGLHCVRNRCGNLSKSGEQCFQNEDCENGACRYDQATMRQRCLAPAEIGTPCGSDDACKSGFCSYKSGTGICAATLAEGAVCGQEASECAPGRCKLDSATSTYLCSAPVTAGDLCTGDAECRRATKLYCVGSVCLQGPLRDGIKCTNDSQCESGSCVAETCRGKGQDGDACGGAKAPCEDGTYCDNSTDGGATGICRAKKAQGDLCATDEECWTRCQPTNGAARCVGVGPGSAFCGGR